MRVLILNDFKKNVGGAEIYTNFLFNKLKDRGHEARFIGEKPVKNKSGYKALFSFALSAFNPFYLKKIGKKIENFGPDVISVHNIYQKLSPLFLTLTGDIPTILTVHSIPQYRYPISFLKKPYKILTFPKKNFLRKMVEKYVDLFIAPSQTMKSFLKDNLKLENVEQIYNPIPWGVAREPRIDNSGRFRILYAGRLSGNKGLFTLLKCMKILNKNCQDVKLDIIGRGFLKKELDHLIGKWDLKEEVHLRGCIEHSKLKKEYKKSDVTVLPSTFEENCPLTLLESISQGTPVITTNIGGQKELVKDKYNGFLINPKSPVELAYKLKILMRNRGLLEDMSRHSLEMAEKFSPKKHFDKLENIFRKLIKEYS